MQHISPCYAYRYQRADESAEAYGLRMANELEAKILELGRGNVAAFIAETVVGATLGRGDRDAGLLQAHPRNLRSATACS